MAEDIRFRTHLQQIHVLIVPDTNNMLFGKTIQNIENWIEYSGPEKSNEVEIRKYIKMKEKPIFFIRFKWNQNHLRL
jgi:hypothetical protein